MRTTISIFALSIAILIGPFVHNAAAADRLILRNLDILTDRTVTSLDEDGLVLDGPRPGGGDRVTWDEVERGRVALDQPRFDRFLAELGPPLYRIRQRLKIGDYEALSEPAEKLYPQFAGRQSQSAYMVCQATMWSRLATGRREAAVEPFVRCYELLRSGAAKIGGLPGTRRLELDPATAMSVELVPVWFDAAAAKVALPGIQEAIRTMAQPRPEGVYAYYVSLALAAGEQAEADRVMRSLRASDGELARWREILLAQREVESGALSTAVDSLRNGLEALPDNCRAAALFWVGRADVQAADEATQRDGVLALLTLPAEYGERQPELAAAGLYHAAAALAKLKEDAGAAAVRSELLGRYASTYHAARWRSEQKAGASSEP